MHSKSSRIDPILAPSFSSTTTTSTDERKHYHQPRTKKSSSHSIVVILGVCCLASGIINVLHVEYTARPATMDQSLKSFLAKALKSTRDELSRTDDRNDEDTEEEDPSFKKIGHRLNKDTLHMKHDDEVDDSRDKKDVKMGYLSCEKFGGPADEYAREMVYWKDIQSDRRYVSPFHIKKGQHRRYMTFEPDGGGWNNIRMAMETVLGLAIAMGRTLVMPPEQRMYLLAKNRGKEKTDFSFADFFPMHELAAENDGLEIITMEQFLEAEAMTGNLRDKYTGEVSFPPNNRTNWNGGDVKILREWLRNVTHTPLSWDPDSCLAAFPASTDPERVKSLQDTLAQIHKVGESNNVWLDNPPLVNASTLERMRDNLAGRSELCIYDESMQNEPVVHFMCFHKMRVRMLVHFYAFLFFESYQEDLWMKRFMRDHVRYIDEIQCAAARIVHAMREYDKSRKSDNNNNPAVGNGEFDTFHIRRGDFQFDETRIEAEEIYQNTKDILSPGATIYIATDDNNKQFFDPLRQHYDIKFLDDFKGLLEGVNTNYYGMIDQLVASRGRLFFGCWHSTFSGYIHRMRGYHSLNQKAPGYENGLLPTSYYYVPLAKQEVLHKYARLHGAFFSREFPTSWRGIDESIGDLPNAMKHD